MAEPKPEPWIPKDGGKAAWLVVAAGFISYGLIFGVINCYSGIFIELVRIYNEDGGTYASPKLALVGSLTIAMVFLLGPIAGILIDRIGLRRTAMIGGSIAVLGMFISSWLTHVNEALYFTYAILFGCGASFVCTSTLSVLGSFFRKRLGLVNGIVTASGSLVSMLLSIINSSLFPLIGIAWVLRFFALLLLLVIGASFFYKIPVEAAKYKKHLEDCNEYKKKTFKSLINMDNFKNKKYLIWGCCGLPIAFFGFFVPYVHIANYITINFPTRDKKAVQISFGLATAASRLFFGFISDIYTGDRIIVQQVAIITYGVLLMLMSVASQWQWEYAVLVMCLVGLFNGGFVSLLGSIAFDLCGLEGGAQAIGFTMGALSIPLTVGPAIAGLIFEHTQSYFIPFLLAGFCSILGGLIMFTMRLVKDQSKGISHMAFAATLILPFLHYRSVYTRQMVL